jgi:hypothetical protein
MDIDLIVDRLRTDLTVMPQSTAIDGLLAVLKDRDLRDRIRSAF